MESGGDIYHVWREMGDRRGIRKERLNRRYRRESRRS